MWPMNTHTVHPDGLDTAEENNTPNCQPASKWLALLNDESVHAPTQRVKARVIKDQAGVSASHALVRDHGSEHDVAFDDDDVLDLAEGNVFYTVARCDY